MQRRQVRLGPVRVPLWAFLVILASLVGGAGWILLHPGSGQSGAANAEASVADGLQAQLAGDIATATAKYEDAIRLDPNNALAHYDLGTIHQAQGDTAGAIDEFKTAARLDPTMTSAFYNLGILFTDTDTIVAVSYYRQAIAADPTIAAAHINLGFLLRTLGQTAEGDTEVQLGNALQSGAATSSTTGTPGASSSSSTSRTGETTSSQP